MSISKEIIEELKSELASKIRQRETVLDQLQLIDVAIEKYDVIIKNMDKEVLKLTDPINKVAKEVKDAYDARIAAGCRSDLVWTPTGKVKVFVSFGSGGGSFKDVSTYEVTKNPATAAFKPYDGIKYYQKPSNRDYGSILIGEFTGNVSQGSSIIAVNIPDQSVIDIFSKFQIGDTVTDNIDSPTIFNLGDLPEITGFGTTDSIGIVTTLVGGISTSSTTFFQFGAGLLDDVEEGMLLIDLGVASETGELEPVLQNDTRIVGFGTGDYFVEYFDEVGILTTSPVPCNTITIDKPALRALEEGEFIVGIVTTFPAIFISTISNQTSLDANFSVIRTANRDNIDADFDFLKSPNSPLKIGSTGSNSLGVGSSAYYDFSGNPGITTSWEPESARNEVTTGKGKKEKVVLPEIKEPLVGAGQASYNNGTLQWPILSTFGFIGFATYASEGTKVRGLFSSAAINYASQPSGGIPSNCGQLDAAISQAESKYSEILSKNRTAAQTITAQTASLRLERDRKETVAWSLLQASANLRKDIARLRQTLRELDGVDFTSYET